ncbi:MAG: TonB family protein [Bacteroidetes bacterium]|nr:TonB family protein [Bacteroidota bacterium]
MITYKTSQADLESKKGLFFEIGMIITLTLVYLVFQIKTPTRPRDIAFDRTDFNLIEEEMINTRQPELPKPQPQLLQPVSLLTIVDNEAKDAQDLSIQAEANQETVMPEYVPMAKNTREEVILEPEIFIVVEEQPSFPGGEAARLKFFNSNIVYPALARELNIMGTVYVGFVVEPDGSLSQVSLLRGIGGGCDEEALRVVNLMPRWNPGKQRGQAVRVRFNLPVRFTLLSS